MPITASDLQVRLSGGASNSDPVASLGGAKSSNVASTNIFDAVAAGEASAGRVEFRCVYVHNAHGTLSLTNPKLWVQIQTPSPHSDVAIGLAPEGVDGTAELVAGETTAPATVSFSAPSSYETGLALPNLGPGQHIAVWIRRTVSASAAAYTGDGFTLRVRGDTPLV